MGDGVNRELVAQFFRADDCPLSVKMVLGGQPAALFRLVAEVARQARAKALEEAAINSTNCKKPLHNTSGMAGVYTDKRSGRWFARLNWKRKVISLGQFATKEEAIAARQAALIVAGFSARHGLDLQPRSPDLPI